MGMCVSSEGGTKDIHRVGSGQRQMCMRDKIGSSGWAWGILKLVITLTLKFPKPTLRIHSREGFGITEFRLGKPNSLLLLLPTESYLTTHFGLAQVTSLIEVTNTVRKLPE